jgi:hypothetical protein
MGFSNSDDEKIEKLRDYYYKNVFKIIILGLFEK